MKKIMASLMMTSLSFCFNASSLAQNKEIKNDIVNKQSFNNMEKLSNNYGTDFNNEEKILLENLLEKQDYTSFYDVFQKSKSTLDKKIEYLNLKKDDGHVPLYWLMADSYAKVKNELDAHFWLYVATIMTQQDAELCYDTTAKFASQKLLRAFPAAPDLTRRTPSFIKPSMDKTIFFIQNLKIRTNPIWACALGTNPVLPGNRILHDRGSWAETRKRVFDLYTKNYTK